MINGTTKCESIKYEKISQMLKTVLGNNEIKLKMLESFTYTKQGQGEKVEFLFCLLTQ